MKLKCRPEDFVVTERSNLQPTSGAFALYRLQKTGLGTPEAIAQIRRTWNLAANRIAHAGLKDRHAVTRQTITIRHGPQTDLAHESFSLEYQGQTDAATTAASIDCNHFSIVIRQLTERQATSLVERVSGHAPVIANYFDQQRFGSLGFSREYVAAACCRRDYERAVWLAMADPNPHDRADEKSQKAILRDHWGDWDTCKQELSRSHRRSIVTYLVDHPQRFRKAFALISADLRGLYLSAFQSAVWNRMLGQMIQQQHLELPLAEIADAEVPLGWLPSAEIIQPDETLPLVSARSKKLSDQQRQLADSATQIYGLRLSEMKIHFPRDRFFARSQRRCWLVPQQISAHAGKDDLYDSHFSVHLQFELPSGSYATMLIRGLTHDLQDNNS